MFVTEIRKKNTKQESVSETRLEDRSHPGDSKLVFLQNGGKMTII